MCAASILSAECLWELQACDQQHENLLAIMQPCNHTAIRVMQASIALTMSVIQSAMVPMPMAAYSGGTQPPAMMVRV